MAEELAQKLGLRLEILSQPCEKELFRRVLIDYVHPWYQVFSYLLDEADIKAIEYDFTTDDGGKRMAAFNKWKEEKGDEATYKSLIQAVLKYDRRDEAEKICETLVLSDVGSREDDHSRVPCRCGEDEPPC